MKAVEIGVVAADPSKIKSGRRQMKTHERDYRSMDVWVRSKPGSEE